MRYRVVVVLLATLLASCGRSRQREETRELDTVDVGGGPDAELTTEFDPQARQVAEEVGGVLPSDFPSDLPLFTPASIVDFGQLPGGRSYVEVDTSVPIAEVRSSLGAQLPRAGWDAAASDGEADTYSKGGRQVRVVLRDLAPGTRVRYEY